MNKKRFFEYLIVLFELGLNLNLVETIELELNWQLY